MAFEHTTKAFDSDLQELTRLVAEMGGLAERQIVESVDALIRRDVSLGARVVEADAEIDQLQRVIEERAVLTIARRQPMACHRWRWPTRRRQSGLLFPTRGRRRRPGPIARCSTRCAG